MKIRTGFVSNSSSSSFIAIVTEPIFEEALTLIEDERYRKILRGVANTQYAFGKKMVVVQEMSDHGGYSSLFGEGDDLDYEKMGLTHEELYPEPKDGEPEDEFYASECLYLYENALEKLQKDPVKALNIMILDDMGCG